MPTIKPRINITLEPEEYDTLKRLSDLTNTSMSKVLKEYITVIMPTLKQVADTVEALKNTDEAAKGELGKMADDALERLLTLQHYASAEYENFNDVIYDAISKKDGEK